MRKEFDIDIDVKSSTEKERYGIRAMVYNGDQKKILPHPAGYYLEHVPIDPYTGCASFDYKYGSELGFMKVDLLTNTVYDGYSSKEEVLSAIDLDNVNWDAFSQESIVEQLPHISKHFDMVSRVEPQSVEDLADILALIRPGKIEYFEKYLKDKETVRKTLYKRAKGGKNYFKKSHAISYALMVLVALNKITNRSGIQW